MRILNRSRQKTGCIIFYLHPYSNNLLIRWSSAEVLQSGAMLENCSDDGMKLLLLLISRALPSDHER